MHNNPLSAIDPSGYRAVMNRVSPFRQVAGLAITAFVASSGDVSSASGIFKLFVGSYVAARVGGADNNHVYA